MASILDVVVPGQGRDHGGAAINLTDAAEDDFRVAIVGLHGSADGDGPAFQMAHVANIFEVVGENNYGERASDLVFAEIQEMDTPGTHVHPQDCSGDTFRFAYVLPGIVNGDAVRSVGGGREEKEREGDLSGNPRQI